MYVYQRVVSESPFPEVGPYGLPDTPIGLGGKMDDTSVVVGEATELLGTKRAPALKSRHEALNTWAFSWKNYGNTFRNMENT